MSVRDVERCRDNGLEAMTMDLYSLKDAFAGEGIIFSYVGPVTQEMTERVGETLRARIELDNASMGVGLRVFSSFVELVQNIGHYSKGRSAEEDSDGHEGVVMVGYKDGRYFVHSGNVIDAVDGPRLAKQLDHLKGMDRKTLRAYYRERRRKDPDSSSKGAGLGFIELARNSSDLTYDIRSIDDESAFFSVQVWISAGQEGGL
ncbi:MAG: hypothetical protein HQL54_07910 [Magnetococcales bacterium]|nr:hypothetical protein [Magnetococcales bacterium]